MLIHTNPTDTAQRCTEKSVACWYGELVARPACHIDRGILMPRHAAPKKQQQVHRSAAAERAYRSGSVTRTIDISRSPSFEMRQRAMATATRHALALGVVGMAFWVYDIGLLVRG